MKPAKPINANDVLEAYNTGMTINDVMRHFRIDFYRTKQILSSFPVEQKRLKAGLSLKDELEIVNQYKAGLSCLACAKKFDRSRSFINHVLLYHGIELRNGSEANVLRFKHQTTEDRRKITAKANKVMRSLPKSFHVKSSKKQAEAKAKSLSKVGQHELEYAAYFKKHGFSCAPQKPFGAYNIDIAVGSVAVEIHVNSNHPHRHSFYSKRIVDLLKGGLSVLYVKVTSKGVNAFGLNQALAHLKELSSHPAGSCQYRVIRGTGELIAVGHLDGNQIALIE